MVASTSLGISDEEFMKQDHSAFLTDDPEEKPAEGEKELKTEDPEAKDDTDETSKDKDDTDALNQPEADDSAAASETVADSEAQEQTETKTDPDKVDDPTGDTPTKLETSGKDDATESLDTSKKDSPETKGDTLDTKEFDYKSAYKKISQPFKANGVEMQVTDPEDVIRLMQKGANYQKKMAQLKPNLKMLSMLEKNGLLEEAKINNLIDLSKKDPAAITKLIEESGINVEDIDKEVASTYKPKNHAVTDTEFDLDQVLEEIKHTPTFDKTINVLTKEWDVPSKTAVSKNPSIISVINTHMSNGVFDKVNEMMQQQRALGKLEGYSDVEGYYQVAEFMAKNGMLKEDNPGKKVDTSKTEVSSQTEAKSKADVEREKQRAAVAPVKQTTTKKTEADNDFLGLSDEEFMKKYQNV
jgi:hypothetical protein